LLASFLAAGAAIVPPAIGILAIVLKAIGREPILADRAALEALGTRITARDRG